MDSTGARKRGRWCRLLVAVAQVTATLLLLVAPASPVAAQVDECRPPLVCPPSASLPDGVVPDPPPSTDAPGTSFASTLIAWGKQYGLIAAVLSFLVAGISFVVAKKTGSYGAGETARGFLIGGAVSAALAALAVGLTLTIYNGAT